MKTLKIQIKSFVVERVKVKVLFEYKCTDNTVKKTLEKAVDEKVDLSFADLRFADLSSAYLVFAKLRFAELREADLSSANLSFADLRFADLHSADLRSTDLSFAKLSHATFRFAKGIKINTCLLNILRYQKGKLRAFRWQTKYEVGKTYKEAIKNCDKDEGNSCGRGLNLATLEWCLQDTNFDLSKTYVEVEFDVKDIIAIPYASDGKFRVQKFRVIRKIPKEELRKIIK
ncbi:hypothetical protein LCGC14_0537050 [marine sediment metagenome]|uniref:Pentapeptide repeat-containing protein n=1 Tax=marine sediment metagenome TaxID=412755 RepID=A0A0F9RU19_9ZZZZ